MSVFITGITGSLGTAISEWHQLNGGGPVFGCARDEERIAKRRESHPAGEHIFCLDARKLEWALTRIVDDYGTHIRKVYHCAALKHVEHGERFPEEAVYQNLAVLEQVILACQWRDCRLVLPSSDKACLPNSVYGATKLIGERMVLNAGFAVVRLGNLIGSSGSVFAKWKAKSDRGEPISITDPEMTRFFLTTSAAAEIAATKAKAREVVVSKMKSIRMGHVAELWKDIKIIGPRDGERTHEWAIVPGTRAKLLDGVFALGQGSIMPDGYVSSEAERWSLTEFAQALAAVDCLPAGAEPLAICE